MARLHPDFFDMEITAHVYPISFWSAVYFTHSTGAPVGHADYLFANPPKKHILFRKAQDSALK